jgi:hypothetical protein
MGVLEHSREYIKLDLQLQTASARVQALHKSAAAHREQVVGAANDVMRIRATITALRQQTGNGEAN